MRSASQLRRLCRCLALSVIIAMAGTAASRGQLSNIMNAPPASREQPVFYQADAVEYNRDETLVRLEGHVEIWQGDRILRADQVTYDRNTDVMAATGHVVLVEPDGQVLFAQYAELTSDMKNGVLRDLRALLPQNGRLAATGARRTNATINEMSKAIYTTCNVCAKNPSAPPLWDIRARSAVQDLEHKEIEYKDALVDFEGWPVAWFPFLAHPDPSVKRASGILIPTIGMTKGLGAYLKVPYYWVIDGQSDATLTPILSSKQGGGLDVDYRQVFNNGKLTVRSGIANDNSDLGGYIFMNGIFAIDDTWRWGFDVNRATGEDYLRDYMVPNSLVNALTSQAYLEAFGQGAYTRLDTRVYQSIITSTNAVAKLPYVLPRYQYSYFGEPDALGGRLSVAADAFNLQREAGTNTQRARLSLDWQRPFEGQFGDLWKLTLHADSAVYSASNFNEAPNWGSSGAVQAAQAMPTAAMEVRLPLVRDAGTWGTQTIEPIAQLIVAPNGSKYGFAKGPNGTTVSTSKVPNEDSLDQELSDANLFALNRFAGVDRLEGGIRVNAALHGAWKFPGGATIDGLVGQAYRMHQSSPWLVGSGLENQVSDIVSRVSFTPGRYFDLTARARFDPHDRMTITFADALASTGPPALRLSAGFMHSSTNPYFYYDYAPTGLFWGGNGKAQPTTQEPYPAPRDEISLGVSTQYGQWKLAANARADVRTHSMDYIGVTGSYENECAIFKLIAYKRYTSIGGDNGDTGVLFQITLKTVGEFGFHPM
jgi:LPS-assembly protein